MTPAGGAESADDLAPAPKELAGRRAENVVLTMAEHGAAAMLEGRLVSARPPAVQVVEPQGAVTR